MGLEKAGRLRKPEGVSRWSNDTALDALARYGHMDRAKLLNTHPVDYLNAIDWLQKGALLIEKSVLRYYKGPARDTHSWVFLCRAHSYW